MKILARFIFNIFSNAIALLAANYFVKGFSLQEDFLAVLTVSFILTLVNLFIRPLLKLIFSPLIILTLGLFIIIINAISLYLVDRFSDFINISGVKALLLATLIIGFVNLIINFSAKRIFNRQNLQTPKVL